MPVPNNIDAILIANIEITDTDTHTYRTNPFDQNNNTGILLLNILNRSPRPGVIGIFVFNGENEQLTVQAIENIDDSGNFDDINVGSSVPIAAGDASKLLIYTRGDNSTPVDFVSLALSFATAPTSGAVVAYARLYSETDEVTIRRY